MTTPTWRPTVKVCGLKRSQDVQIAITAGADAVGFVEAPWSPRAVSRQEARRLAAMTPDQVVSVGVFVNHSPEFVRRWCEYTGVGAIQLSGDEVPAEWAGFPLPILRRVAVVDGGQIEMAAWGEVASAFLLDHAATPGGSGRRVPATLAKALAGHGYCLLAGGLHGGNVADAIRQVRPKGVDASSRLEESPGRKDPDRVMAFVREARNALKKVTV